MQRITISLDDLLAVELDRLLQGQGYSNRSEGVRDLVRGAIEKQLGETTPSAVSVASLSYIYNHRVRSLANRLSEMQHAQHDIVVSTTLVHLDHDHSLETVVLRGATGAVRAFSDMVSAERGVRSAMLNIVGVEVDDEHHHKGAHSHDGHLHLTPALS